VTRPISVVAADSHDQVQPYEDAVPVGSVLARLRAQAAEQAKDRTVDVAIAGAFDPPIMARYGVLPTEELERYSELAGGTSNLSLVLDMLSRTLRCLVTEDGGREVELRDELGTVTYGHRLAVLLGMPIPPGETEMPPRDVILQLFGGNAFALAAHASEVVSWMQNPGGPSPGESLGATE
jgi:hypothetical protein